jgi:uncharacterized protein YcaQ
MIEISPEQARNHILDAQGLRTTRMCNSVTDVAHRVHNIQIDTISVVARSHNLTTFNRFLDYENGDIWNHLREGKLFEYWSHSICLMPFETYQFSAWRKKYYHDEMWGSFKTWGIKNKETIEQVYQKVKQDGVINSASIGERRTGPSTGWWDWKIEKRALEFLFYMGDLMIAYRDRFQKFYDLPERVIPAGINTEPLTDDEAARFIVKSTLKSLGLGTHQDIRTYHGTVPSKRLWTNNRTKVEEHLDSLKQEGIIEEVKISGFRDRYFTMPEHVDSILSGKTNTNEATPVKILSPFDNILRERHYPKRVWNFKYSLECYVPPQDRVYGYFVLPILDLNQLAGRLDAKVHRKEGTLEVKSLYIENEGFKTEEGLYRLKAGLESFAAFHNCEKISLGNVQPRKLTKTLRPLLTE